MSRTGEVGPAEGLPGQGRDGAGHMGGWRSACAGWPCAGPPPGWSGRGPGHRPDASGMRL